MENLENYELANPFKRFLSFVLDSFVVCPVFFVIYFFLPDVDFNLGENNDLLFKSLYNILFLVYLLTIWISFKGQSIGQKIMNVKIISIDNKEITTKQSLLRMLGWLACNMTFGIGFLVMFFNKECRGLHDFTSNSKVIDLTKLKELN